MQFDMPHSPGGKPPNVKPDIKDKAVTVAVSSDGTSVHTTRPREWQAKIGKIPVAVV